MIRKIQRHWFEVWGDEEAQNRILKYILLVLIAVTGIEACLIMTLALRKPLLVSPGLDATRIINFSEPDPAVLMKELIRVIENYIRTRHTWDFGTIEARAKAASQYIAPDFREKFFLNVQEQIRLAREKQIAQKIYPESPQINVKEKKAVVSAERILIVAGLRAAQSMTFELRFTYGERTEQNPEGIYITSEKLLN